MICHGIPDTRSLKDGDICNVDVTVYHNGFHGDLNETFFVGNVTEKHKNLVKVTHECLMKAVQIVKPGEKYREIGNVIQKHAQANGYSVVRSYCGHGIHQLFHTAPNVPHYASKLKYNFFVWQFNVNWRDRQLSVKHCYKRSKATMALGFFVTKPFLFKEHVFHSLPCSASMI